MSPMLPRRPLGSTGIEVSLLGLGTVKLGRDRGLRHPHPFTIPDEASAARLLDAARDLGVDLLDTAPAYGDAEARLGRLLRGRREDFVLVTKAGEHFDGERSHFDFSYDHTLASVRRSLRRLATDRLDCVLVHSDGDDLAILEDGGALDALAELRRAGDIRSFGISTKTVAGTLAAAPLVDVVMVTVDPGAAEERAAVVAAAAAGCGVLVKKALASGHARDPAAALQRAAACPGVHSVVVGTIDPAHLAANAAALG